MKYTKIILTLYMAGFMFSCVSVKTSSVKSKENTAKVQKALDLEEYPQPQLDISMYPKAEEGYRRKIIYLPKLANEEDLTIEFYAGNMVMVDCNRYGFIGNMEEQLIEGWGYTYYTYESTGEMVSTKMACPEGSKHEEFVTGERLTVTYNSRLPIVVYVPADFEVRYQVWEKHAKEYRAE